MYPVIMKAAYPVFTNKCSCC